MKIPLPSAPGVALRPGQVRPITAWLVTWGPVLLAAALLAVAAPGVFLPSWELLAIFLLLSIAAQHFQIPLASAGSQTFGPAVALPATAAVLAVYALATTVQAGLFLAAIFEMPLGAVLLIGALWRIPTAAALGASGLSIAIAIWGGEAPVLLVPLVIASLIALLFT